MKSNLSHLIPVWKACAILGPAVVERIVRSLLRYRQKTMSAASALNVANSSSNSNAPTVSAAAAANAASNYGSGMNGGATTLAQQQQQHVAAATSSSSSSSSNTAITSGEWMFDEEEVQWLIKALFYRHPPPPPTATVVEKNRWNQSKDITATGLQDGVLLDVDDQDEKEGDDDDDEEEECLLQAEHYTYHLKPQQQQQQQQQPQESWAHGSLPPAAIPAQGPVNNSRSFAAAAAASGTSFLTGSQHAARTALTPSVPGNPPHRAYPNPPPIPPVMQQAWKRWMQNRLLALDKSTILQFLVPASVQPHAGPQGHAGLYDCLTYALQGHGPAGMAGTPSPLILLPDVLIVLAICKDYQDWQEGKHVVLQQLFAEMKNEPKPQQKQQQQEKKSSPKVETESPTNKNNKKGEESPVALKSSGGFGKQNDNYGNEEVVVVAGGILEGDDTDTPMPAKIVDVPLPAAGKASRRMPPIRNYGRRAPPDRLDVEPIENDEEEDDAADHHPHHHGHERSRNSTTENKKKSNKTEANKTTKEKEPAPSTQEEEQQEEDTGRSAAETAAIVQEQIVTAMGRLAYRLYDSYQKKGIVTRDTIHRFLTDVHGEDSYKETPVRKLLDELFESKPGGKVAAQQTSPPAQGPGWLHATISEQDFCKRILSRLQLLTPTQETPVKTVVMPPPREHLLLDWMCHLIVSMIPTKALPPSVAAYLDTMEQAPKPVSEVYGVADFRLYEMKRRFHSLVQASAPSLAVTASTAAQQSDDPLGTVAAAPDQHQQQQQSVSQPKQSITKTAFCQAVGKANEEMGHGGYLPYDLAVLIFRAGCCHRLVRGEFNSNNAMSFNSSNSRIKSALGERDLLGSDDYYDETTLMGSSQHSLGSSSGGQGKTMLGMEEDSSPQLYWGLYEVLQFGCMGVRHNKARREDPDLPLLRFLFGVFRLWKPTAPKDLLADDVNLEVPPSASEMDVSSPNFSRRVLTRTQVARMLLFLLEHADFRLHADAPPNADEADVLDEHKLSIGEQNKMEQKMVSVGMAYMLDILPPDIEVPKNNGNTLDSKIPLKVLVDFAMSKCASKECMDFEEFSGWNKDTAEDGPPMRMTPLMVELRLVAAVLFGIPPTLATLEVSLVAEIERRHKERYPQSTTSRRGPRGTVWYIIDFTWFKNWSEKVKQVAGTEDDAKDGRDDRNSGVRGLKRIDNAGLLAENGSLALRADIRWRHDYEILPPLAWHALVAWYDGGPPIFRTVVRYITSSGPPSVHSRAPRIPTDNEIELYPFFVTVYLCDAISRGEARPFQQNYQLSRVTPVGIMLVQLCKELDVDPDMARLWVMGSNPDANIVGNAADDAGEDWILNTDMNIVEQRKRRKNGNEHAPITLLLEIKDKQSGLWPRGLDGKEWAFRDKNAVPGSSDLGDGIVGLYNMGNTCYLNSSVQCLSHTPIFREYFTSKAYLNDINTTNPLGHQGRLAQVSAELINSLWKRFQQGNSHSQKRPVAPVPYGLVNAPALTPKTFKDSLGKFNEHFQGNEQHDAQELLAFLLGGLSEDLNRIVEKPYIEAPDSDGRPDSELADIWWSNHLKREMSIIVALFTGQYKSLLSCRTCKYESARFEPFLFLQVPLPEDDTLSVSLVLYPLSESMDVTRYSVRVPNNGNLKDVLIALAKILDDDKAQNEHGEITIDIDSDDPEERKAARERYSQKAQDLAVVDMRDGYIFKIAPTSWKLQDLQNKETGELPLLHVYELEPLSPLPPKIPKTVTDSEGSEKGTAGEEDETLARPSFSFLAVAQRRSELISRDFLHPLAQRVFGTPLLLRVNDLEKRTGRDVYDIIAERLRTVVPRSALRFLARSTENSTALISKTLSSDEKELNRQTATNRTKTDMEEVSAGTVPRYGFRLRITSRDGRRCLICPWYECCIGCFVPDDDAPTSVMNGDSLVIDWHFAVDVATSGFGQRLVPLDPISSQPISPIRPRPAGVTIKNHSSCGTGLRKDGRPDAISLEDCLDSFAQEERIPEAYCSKCKDFRIQTKMMSLWRLPPIVIIHLKRFQFTQHMRRKLRDLVVFPVEGLDLSRIMAKSAEPSSSMFPLKGSTKDSTSNAQTGLDGTEATDASESVADDQSKDKGRSHMLYDLYGVVHHQGALTGGHYVATLKSELDGQWRLFNDAQIYEIPARDVVDASAYILFYIRRDVSKAELSQFWDVRERGNLSQEDMDHLLKGRSDKCVIS